MRQALIPRVFISIIVVISITLSLVPLSITGILDNTIIVHAQTQDSHGVWTPIDVSDKSIDVVGEKIGRYGYGFAGWYTDTVKVDPHTSTIVIAWARWDADRYGNDFIYLAFLKPVDIDGDGSPEAYQKIIKLVDRVHNLVSLDSLTLANGKVLITWTYNERDRKNNIAGALFDTDGNLLWGPSNIRRTHDYEEYSRSCYVPGYNGGNGGFLIVWYERYSIYGKWLYNDGEEWRLTKAFSITNTRLHYTKADQILCIGGKDKALVVYRYNKSGNIGVYARLVQDTDVSDYIEVYDSDREEVIGVRGAYSRISGKGYFLVPFITRGHIGYTIIRENDGAVEKRISLSKGYHPYAINVSNGFVLTWICSIDRKVWVGKINPRNNWSIRIKAWRDKLYMYHPIIAFDPVNSKYILVYTGGDTKSNLDIRFAVLKDVGNRLELEPGYPKTLVSGAGGQVAHGLGLISMDTYVVAYKDTGDGEEDLLAYVVLPDVETVDTITLYRLPAEGNAYKQKIIDLINNADNSIYIAMAYWDEGDSPCDTDSTIAKALIEKARSNPNIDIRVILDDDTSNDVVKQCLSNNGISVIDSSSAGENHIMHDKFIVVDGSRVLVTTANLVDEDLYYNNNTAIYIESKAIAYFYSQEFLHMWDNGNGRFGENKTRDHSFIAFIEYANRIIVFEGYFGPQIYGVRGRIPEVIYGYITRAKSSVYFASYIFTTSGWVTPIYNAIVEASNNGKDVIGVFDEDLNVDVPGRRLYWFIDKGVPVAIDNHPYKMHAKLFVIDNRIAVLGSWNPTRSATIIHDENILVIRDPDVVNGLAKQIGDYILEMYNSNLFIKNPYKYNPTHPVITRVMFKPDNSSSPRYEWVEIYNPTNQVVDLGNYVIGDAENILEVDNEGMYKFPKGAKIGANEAIIIAYNATAFHEVYGFYPNYEIVDSTANVPDLIPYNTSKFTGEWNLDDAGDEVILARDQNGFLVVIDAVWYGNSTYMKTGVGQPDSGRPLDVSSTGLGYGIISKKFMDGNGFYDAIRMSDKYVLGYLWNKPANVMLSLKGYVIDVILRDPDNRVVSIVDVTIKNDTHEISLGSTNEINLSQLQLSEGNYTVGVEYEEDYDEKTFSGDRKGVFSTVSDQVLVAIRTVNEDKIYLVSSQPIISIEYDVINETHHRIIVLVRGDKSGYVNLTMPSNWDSVDSVYLNGVLLQRGEKWDVTGGIIWIDPIGDANITIIGGASTPPPPQPTPTTPTPIVLGGYASPYMGVVVILIIVIIAVLVYPVYVKFKSKKQ